MFIPREQLEKEVIPIAYKIIIWLIPDKPADGKTSVGRQPDGRQRERIKEAVGESLRVSGYHMCATAVCERKLELIIEAPADVEKIINTAVVSIIEKLRCTDKYPEKINLWQPQKKVESLWTQQSLQKAIDEIEQMQEKGLEIRT